MAGHFEVRVLELVDNCIKRRLGRRVEKCKTENEECNQAEMCTANSPLGRHHEMHVTNT